MGANGQQLPELSFASLPDEAQDVVLSMLSSYDLRACCVASKAWQRAILRAPEAVRHRASWLHQWTAADAGALIEGDRAVCTGAGTWHPGGVSVATTLHLSTKRDMAFRLIIEKASSGDILAGITLHTATQPGPTVHSRAEQPSLESYHGTRLLGMGYDYIMGRTGEYGGVAPPSIFYGGRSLRCCYSEPGGEGIPKHIL